MASAISHTSTHFRNPAPDAETASSSDSPPVEGPPGRIRDVRFSALATRLAADNGKSDADRSFRTSASNIFRRGLAKLCMEPLAARAVGRQSEPAEKTEAIEKLTQIKGRFQALLDRNWATDQSLSVFDGDFDHVILPTMVAAENARKAASSLVVLDSSHDLKMWLAAKNFPLEGKRALVPLPLPNMLHVVAADARRINGKTSLFIIDPLTPTADRAEAFDAVLLEAFRECIADHTTLTMLMLGTQKARVGCRIFALSAASKLADQHAMFDILHAENLSGRPLTTSRGENVQEWAGSSGIRMIGGEGMLTPDFMKHSQSRNTLQAWLEASPQGYSNATVNRRGQTLLSRYQSNLTERYRRPTTPQARWQSGGANSLPRDWTELLRTSTSIERKRIIYIDRAIAYLRQAPPSESEALLGRLRTLDPVRHAIDDLGLNRRQLGPNC